MTVVLYIALRYTIYLILLCNAYVAIYIESLTMHIFTMRYLYQCAIHSEARNLCKDTHRIYTNTLLLSMHILVSYKYTRLDVMARISKLTLRMLHSSASL